MNQHVVVVIGAGGIGQAIGRRQGAGRTVLLADRNEKNLATAAEALEAAGHTVTHPPRRRRVPRVRSRPRRGGWELGDVVNVVHTAGLSPVQASPQAILAVDLFGVALVLDEFGQVIAPGGAGVVISSMAGHMLRRSTRRRARTGPWPSPRPTSCWTCRSSAPKRSELRGRLRAVQARQPPAGPGRGGHLGRPGRPGQRDQPRHHPHPAGQGRDVRARRRGLPDDDRPLRGRTGRAPPTRSPPPPPTCSAPTPGSSPAPTCSSTAASSPPFAPAASNSASDLQPRHTKENTMKHVTARHPRRRPHRPGHDGHVRRLHRRRQRRRRVHPHHPPGPRPRRHPYRHRRGLRALHQRGTRRPRHQGPPRPGRARHQVRVHVQHRPQRRPDSSPENIRIAVEGSLRRLDTDHIDLYYQHRVDPQDPDRRGHRRRSPSSSPRARSATSACPKPGSTPSAAPTPCTRSPRCSRSTRSGPATPKTACSRCCRELGIGFVPYSPLGHGFLTGTIRSIDDLDDNDWRKTNPRFTGENFQRNLRHRRRGPSRRRRSRRHPRPGRPRLAARQRQRHRPHPRHQARPATGGERRRRRHRADRRADRHGSTTSPPPPATTTTKRRPRCSNADTAA